jgi:hypothetical protein
MSTDCRQTTGVSWGVRAPRPKKPPEPPKRRGWIYAAAALLLAGYLLFAHGCHGDEDNELLARLGDALSLVR